MAGRSYSIKTRNLVIRPMEKEEMKALEGKTPEMDDIIASSEGLDGDPYFFACLWEVKDRKGGQGRGFFHLDGPVENYETKVSFLGVTPEDLKELLPELCNTLFYGDLGIYYVRVETRDEQYAEVLESKEFKQVDGSIYELEKPRHSMLSFGISIGMCLGVSLGTALKSIGIGICLGVGLGALYGAAIDAKSRSLWAEVEENRKK